MRDCEKLKLQNQSNLKVKSTSNNEFLRFFTVKLQKFENFLGV